MTLTQELLKEYLHYEPQSGVFTWIKSPAKCVKAGVIAGSFDSSRGYITIAIKSKDYRAHRLAWFYVHGYFPDQIDHLNHNKTDNSLANLANVTKKENTKDRSNNKNNTSGVHGVCWITRRLKGCAFIGVNGKPKILGHFKDIEEATKVRGQAELFYGFHANHGKDLSRGSDL